MDLNRKIIPVHTHKNKTESVGHEVRNVEVHPLLVALISVSVVSDDV